MNFVLALARLRDRTSDGFLKLRRLIVTSSRKLGEWILENFGHRLPGISQESKKNKKGNHIHSEINAAVNPQDVNPED